MDEPGGVLYRQAAPLYQRTVPRHVPKVEAIEVRAPHFSEVILGPSLAKEEPPVAPGICRSSSLSRAGTGNPCDALPTPNNRNRRWSMPPGRTDGQAPGATWARRLIPNRWTRETGTSPGAQQIGGTCPAIRPMRPKPREPICACTEADPWPAGRSRLSCSQTVSPPSAAVRGQAEDKIESKKGRRAGKE